eukprot:CAMPEP_0114338318 /NCGR_PEP_ID=MMETSP0101-20121206/6958_1 /TAXON_ID=38822 ORGANISM="Pteridomonas danica, Strain PT" /NCGR_SAMPLE_ID=MMETSP0101 /ASSEMBLY_ACC=CAM_ASM_000211 /LENGTH=130 /DNA_ID=CAMNT_0001470863 /DNA_START=84 /DNA_END=476 /DNA_ORIENTATION=-
MPSLSVSLKPSSLVTSPTLMPVFIDRDDASSDRWKRAELVFGVIIGVLVVVIVYVVYQCHRSLSRRSHVKLETGDVATPNDSIYSALHKNEKDSESTPDDHYDDSGAAEDENGNGGDLNLGVENEDDESV